MRAISIWCWAQGYCLPACADLLDIPRHPRLAQHSESAQLGADPALESESAGTQGLPGGAGVGQQPSELEAPGAARPLGVASGTSSSTPVDGGPDSSPGAPDAGDSVSPAPRCEASDSLGPDGNCYAIIAELLAQADARARCRARGALWDLAAVHDAESNGFVAGLIAEEAWLGGSDGNREGSWLWLRDGIPFWLGDETGNSVNDSFANWNSDEPNGGAGSDCVRMNPRTARWADLECDGCVAASARARLSSSHQSHLPRFFGNLGRPET